MGYSIAIKIKLQLHTNMHKSEGHNVEKQITKTEYICVCVQNMEMNVISFRGISVCGELKENKVIIYSKCKTEGLK